MAEKVVRFSDVEEKMFELFDDDDYEGSKVELGDDCYAITDGLIAEIPELGLAVEGGIVMQQYESGEWMADWSATFIFESGDRPQNYLCCEQDGIEMALHNYLMAEGKGRAASAGMKCIIKPERDISRAVSCAELLNATLKEIEADGGELDDYEYDVMIKRLRGYRNGTN